jgi:hypothetical protein
MTFRARVLNALAFLILLTVPAGVALGQTVITTGPITTTDNVEWTIAASDALSASAAQLLPLRIRDNGIGTFVTLNSTGCTAVVTPVAGFVCTTKVTAALAAMVNVRGTHSLAATWLDVATGTESPASVPFVLTTPAGAPTGLRITR